jgi:hypothetical protein
MLWMGKRYQLSPNQYINSVLSQISANFFLMVKILRVFVFLLYSYVHTMFGSFLPPSPCPFSYPPPLPPATPRYPAETILPLSLVLLKTEYKQ